MCIDPAKTYTASVETNKGTYHRRPSIATKAPQTVNNFVVLARYHYYDGTSATGSITGFVVQCGDPTGTGTGGPGYEFADELPEAGEYTIGSLAMANSGPNTNGSQFFIITGDSGRPAAARLHAVRPGDRRTRHHRQGDGGSRQSRRQCQRCAPARSRSTIDEGDDHRGVDPVGAPRRTPRSPVSAAVHLGGTRT